MAGEMVQTFASSDAEDVREEGDEVGVEDEAVAVTGLYVCGETLK
jgi:hypothetical protein